MGLVRCRHANRKFWVVLTLVIATVTTGACSAQPDPPPDYYVAGNEALHAVAGPEGVAWCSSKGPGWTEFEDRAATARRLTIHSRDDDSPVISFEVPPFRNTPNVCMVTPDAGVYFSMAVSDRQRPDNPRPAIRVYSFLSPEDLDDVRDDPSHLLHVDLDDLVADPVVVYSTLMNGRLRSAISQRCREQVSVLAEILAAPEKFPNEPWRIDPDAGDKFGQALYELLNRAIGSETVAASLYSRQAYQPTLRVWGPGEGPEDLKLPAQIVKQMETVWELGVDPNSDATPALTAAVVAQQSQDTDPWANFRTKPDEDEETEPKESETPSQDPEANLQIRLLNRMLIEYELLGAMHGTIYKWVKDLPGAVPCECGPEEHYRAVEGFRHEDLKTMPHRLDAHGELEILVSRLPDPDDAEEPTEVYIVGPWGELEEPEEGEPLGMFFVSGTRIEWVNVEYEGQLPDWSLQ